MSNQDNNKGDINRLAAGIAKAKLIQDKVVTKSYTTGHINREALTMAEGVELLPPSESVMNKAPIRTTNFNHNDTITSDKIENSKLPESIKESFMKNPPLASANPLSLDLMSSVAELAKSNMTSNGIQPQRRIVENNVSSQHPITEYVKESSQMITLSIESLKNIIEEAVEKTVNKMVEVTKNEVDENFIIEVSGKKYVATAKLMKEVTVKK